MTSSVIVQEIEAKSILSVSKVYDYVVNPYTGCEHGCTYCYARFMKRFTRHSEPWGSFVDVKVNAPDLLRREITRKKQGRVWMSGVCDPYQPLEERYRITRRCLAILAENGWPVVVQTRSPLVLRDADILVETHGAEAGLSIPTADDGIRVLFEPHAPAIAERFDALDELHRSGIRTYAMIAPMLPGAEGLATMLEGKIDYVILDRMNYNHAHWVYRKYGLQDALSEDFARRVVQHLALKFRGMGIECTIAC
jgi:DNA repair photolyase